MLFEFEVGLGLWEARLPRGRELLLKAARNPVVIVKDDREGALLEDFAAWCREASLFPAGRLVEEYWRENKEMLLGAYIFLQGRTRRRARMN